MAEDHRRRPPPLAPDDVEVGAADPDRSHAHEHVGRARVVEADLLDGERTAGLMEERRAGLHRTNGSGRPGPYDLVVARRFAAERRFSTARTSFVDTRWAMFCSA